MIATNNYHVKPKKYFSNIRVDILDLLPEKYDRVLVLGCGDGATLLEIKRRRKTVEVHGIDIVPFPKQKLLDKLH